MFSRQPSISAPLCDDSRCGEPIDKSWATSFVRFATTKCCFWMRALSCPPSVSSNVEQSRKQTSRFGNIASSCRDPVRGMGLSAFCFHKFIDGGVTGIHAPGRRLRLRSRFGADRDLPLFGRVLSDGKSLPSRFWRCPVRLLLISDPESPRKLLPRLW